MENKTNNMEVQGAKNVTEETKKKLNTQQVLKSNATNIKKFEEYKMLEKADIEKLKEIHEKLIRSWIGGQLKF